MQILTSDSLFKVFIQAHSIPKGENQIPLPGKYVKLGPWQWIWGFLKVKDTIHLFPLPFPSSSYYVLLGRKFFLTKLKDRLVDF